VEPAIRPLAPQLIPREPPTSIVPRPPPPDWAREPPPPPPRIVPRHRQPSVEPWPTSLVTLPAPVYQPLDDPPRRPRRRAALGSYALAVALASLALAFWQIYWLLESTEIGRALLDRASAAIAAIIDKL
jgi:hypothetical protein